MKLLLILLIDAGAEPENNSVWGNQFGHCKLFKLHLLIYCTEYCTPYIIYIVAVHTVIRKSRDLGTR